MRKVIFSTLIVSFAYLIWYAIDYYTNIPLQEKILPFSADQIQQLSISSEGTTPFQIYGLDEGWMVAGKNLELTDQNHKIETLIQGLLNLKSDSVVRNPDINHAPITVNLSLQNDQSEQLDLYVKEGQIYMASLGLQPDYYALQSTGSKHDWLKYLSFEAYRTSRILQPGVANVDSMRLIFTDTMRLDTVLGSSHSKNIAQYFISPKYVSFADNFDEIRYRDWLYADIIFYSAADTSILKVYLDEDTDSTLVVTNPAYPYRHIRMDSLPEVLSPLTFRSNGSY